MSHVKKHTTNQRLKKIEKAIGELFIMVHHLSKKIDLFEEQHQPKDEKP